MTCFLDIFIFPMILCVFFPSSWQAKFLFSHTPHSLTHKNIVTFKHQVTPIITYFGSYFISVIIITIIWYYDFSLFCFVWYFLACITWYVATHTIFGCYDSLCDECIAYHIYERRYLVHLLIMFFLGYVMNFFDRRKFLTRDWSFCNRILTYVNLLTNGRNKIVKNPSETSIFDNIQSNIR